MSESKHNPAPYKKLGLRLKQLRENLHESLAEVSGAVEIDQDVLVTIEQGKHRPSEDVLLLLINHFDPQEEEAVSLWEMAGYDQSNSAYFDDGATKPIVMLMQPDTRVMYSDMVNVVSNQQGVVLNFLQSQAQGQPTVISRVGMSRDQAMNVMRALQHSLVGLKPLPKALPEPKKLTDESNADQA